MLKSTMHIGIDDTDSTRNGCTTYIAALLLEELEKLQARFIDYPNLIRLNPNVPWKTRGNGALCLRVEFEEELEAEIKKSAIGLVEKNADLNFKGTDPGIVFFKSREIPEELKAFAKNAETGIVTLKEATKLISKFEGEALGFNTCRGIIGALAAIGETLQGDHTYELIAYRTKENRGSKRQVDEDSIFEMDRLTQPYTFNNVDLEKHRVIITPRGPDPILLGIRGETPETVKKAFAMVKPLEPVERWVVFRTNQGTDAHLLRASALNELNPYSSVIARGVVSRNPRIVPVRHVIFSIKDATGEVDCAAYEPTGGLRKVAKELIEGDEVEVCGAVRRRQKGKLLTLNLEKIIILSLALNVMYRNPKCQSCGKRLESMGKEQGFRCKKCGARYDAVEKVRVSIDRPVEPGLYVTSTRSQRHLTKPLRRYGLEKNHCEIQNMIKDWHSQRP
jgi:tRNA(Ile2)-agmatinylcytidine synthase